LDGWISQAKQLQGDIERSKDTACEIVQGAQAGKTLNAQVKDALSRVALLRKELEYNTSLADMIEQLQIISGLLENAHDSASQNELLGALEKLCDARKCMARLGCFENNRFCGIIQRRETQIRDLLVSKIVGCWSELVVTNQPARQVTIKRNLQRRHELVERYVKCTDSDQKTISLSHCKT
jgi:centromere/kinetochore protein ZW10